MIVRGKRTSKIRERWWEVRPVQGERKERTRAKRQARRVVCNPDRIFWHATQKDMAKRPIRESIQHIVLLIERHCLVSRYDALSKNLVNLHSQVLYAYYAAISSPTL